MFGPRSLYLFSLLFFYSVFGESKNVRKSEVTEDFKKDNSRTDAEQDPFTSVFMAPQSGDTQSTLFSTCLAESRTFEAKFASIEVVPGSEYIRYVSDSLQLSFPITWNRMSGGYPSILDCAEAAHNGGWSTFKYDGASCEVFNSTYRLNDVAKCEEEDSDAVFILSTAFRQPIKFFAGYDNSDREIWGFLSEKPMNSEAVTFCLEAYPDQELSLFVNEHPPLTVQSVINNFTQLGYTETNLWVDAEERGQSSTQWYGNFASTDWWDGQFPAYLGPNAPFRARAAYLDKDSNFKLRVSDKSIKMGVLCITFAWSSPE